MDFESALTSPFRFWRRLRLGQKVMIAVSTAIIPLVALGVQVSNITSSLLRDQVHSNLGMASNVEAGRMEQSMALAETSMSAVSRDNSVRNAATDAAAGSNLEAASVLLQLYADITGPRLAESGMVGLSFYLPANPIAAATYGGGVSPTSEVTAQAFVGDGSYSPVAFLVDNEPRITTVRKVGDGNPITVVAEWSVPRLIEQQDISDQLGFPVDSMLLQGNPDGTFLVLAANQPELLGTAKSLEVAAPIAGNPVVGDVVLSRASNRDAVQAASRMDEIGWIWLLEADSDDVYRDLGRVRAAIITVFLIAGFLVLAVVAAAFRGLARRLARMTRLAEAIASGDLTVRTGDHRLDELGRLSNAFDDMAQSLSEDIARRERVEAQLAYQATHDALTGLPNRQHLIDELDDLLEDCEDPVSALFIDLDGFKEVNDRLGHAAGDELLTRVGDRLRDVLRPGDFVARLGGDEFVIILRGLGIIEAERTATRVVGALELPFIVLDEEVGISASIGVSGSDTERSAETLLKNADIAMYQAKSMGKGRAVPVTPEALQQADDRLSLVARLRSALSTDGLELLYWPIVDLQSGSLLGMESTVRWNDPESGMIAPEDFLALAQRSGLSSQIDEWVVGHSFRQLFEWSESGLPVGDLFISINLTPESFLSQRTRALLVSELARNSIAPSTIRIEVPESVLAADSEPLRAAFKYYRSMGVAVTVDQFGSGYSNLDRLPRFAIETVKIDLGSTSDLSGRVATSELVKSLITLAHVSGMRVAAAGVDNALMRDELLELGCHQGQGLWYSAEVDGAAFGNLLSSRDLLGFMAG